MQALQHHRSLQQHDLALHDGANEGGGIRLVPGCVGAVADDVTRLRPNSGCQCVPGLLSCVESLITLGPVTHPRSYAGENDCTESEIFSGYYACQLAGLASDWRAGFQSPDAVWASVQLNAYFQAQNSHTLADFRAMQAATGDESIPSSYTARIFDLGDVTSPLGNIHSRNKQATGVRISAGIRALLYNESAVTSGPTYASATYGGVSTGSLTVTVSFQPGTVDGGFVYVPPHASPWSNSTRCPADIQRSADAYCAWFSIIASNGIAYNATVVEVTGGGADQLVLTAPGVPVGYTAVGSSFGWGDWPVVNHYAKASGLPLAPWYVNGTGAWQLPVPAPVRER